MPAEMDFIFLPDYHAGGWNSETIPEHTTKGSVLASEWKIVYDMLEDLSILSVPCKREGAVYAKIVVKFRICSNLMV